jgi:DNA adenine methylase
MARSTATSPLGGTPLRVQLDAARATTARAFEVLAPDLLEKTIWGSPAGKKRLAKRLAAMLPAHKTYVEPFAGSGAVLFAKPPAMTEVINDADPEIAAAYRAVQKMTPEAMTRLQQLPWTGDKATFQRLLAATPKGDVEKLHRFLYLSHFSYGKLRTGSFSPSSQGVEARTLDRIAMHAPRLRKVKVYSGDYAPVIKRYDGKDTAMFLDPPYAGYDAAVGEKTFDEHRFFGVLKAIKGKWLMTYGVRGELPKLVKDAGYHVRKIRTPRTIRSMRGVGGSQYLTQLLVSNYAPTQKALGLADGVLIEPWNPAEDAELAIATRLLKAEERGDERYVLGVVLEPETVDAQDDIYSADEVRKAAHLFLEEYGGVGLMHQVSVADRVKIVESYLAPVDFAIGDATVVKGTWLLGLHVLDDGMWGDIKAGRLTGLSIGGSARKVPNTSAPKETP